MSDQIRLDLSKDEPGRKGEILQAAASVFAQDGYDSGSMRQIAEQVGVSEPALYRHFASKEDLFVALLHAASGHLIAQATDLIGAINAKDLHAQLLAAVSNRRKALGYYAPLLRALMGAASRNRRFLTELRTTIIEPLREALVLKAAEIDHALGAPADAETSRDGRVRALQSLFMGYVMSSFVLGDAPDEAIVDAALRIMGWDERAQ